MKKNLAGNEKGFTLIELIVVIVLLGLLAAVAIPKYQDLTTEANMATANGILTAARGAATINYAKNLAGGGVTPITADGAGAAILKGLIDYTNPDDIVAGTGEDATLTWNSYVITITADEDTTTTHAAAKLSAGWLTP
jgi:MSHA pilin protein MshA